MKKYKLSANVSRDTMQRLLFLENEREISNGPSVFSFASVKYSWVGSNRFLAAIERRLRKQLVSAIIAC